MSKTESSSLNPSQRPPLEDEDFESPFLHGTTSITHVIMVLVTVIITCVLVGVALFLA